MTDLYLQTNTGYGPTDIVLNLSAVAGTVTAPTGGTRRHMGISSGRKQRTGHGRLAYQLTLTGTGTIRTVHPLAAVTLTATGTVTAEGSVRPPTLLAQGSATGTGRLTLPRPTGRGQVTENEEELLLILELI